MKCKITNNKIKNVISFGKMPLANGFLNKKDFKKEFFYNLETGFSEKLSLFQLNDHPKPKQMFNIKYPFFTGSSKYMKTHFQKYSKMIKGLLQPNSKLIEIGSNDGTFLKNFSNSKIKSVGFEPSKNVSDIAKKNKIDSRNKFFSYKNILNEKSFLNKTDIICASNVICHIPDLRDLIKSIDLLLNKNGIFIFEEPYLGSMFEKVSYDQIYDEHIYIFSASSIKKIFNLFDFELIDAIPQITHGGSMRYIISRSKNRKTSKRLSKILDYEKKNNIDNFESCKKFKKDCENSRNNLRLKIKKLKENGKTICGYAATSKSTTILNYCNIDNTMLDYIADTTPEKIGKFSPGKHIPIVSMDYFRKNLTDSIYLFAWNHKNEIFKKEKKILKKKINWFSHIKL